MKAKWTLDAAVFCSVGKVRPNNEDNFYFNGFHLKKENKGLEKPVHKRIAGRKDSIFCVFDGIGGGDYGETASFAGAGGLKEEWEQIETILQPEQLLEEICQNLNLAVCRQQEALGSERMGSTMALLLFHDGDVYMANVGDSKVFLLRDKEMRQISQDHDDSRYLQQMEVTYRKPRLTQYLGMNPGKVQMQPYICSGETKPGDRFLICSDGLTDMVEPEEISRILAESEDAEQAVMWLNEAAMNHGGVDNTTVMVCVVEDSSSGQKRHWPFSRKKQY